MVIARRQRETPTRHVRKNFLFFLFFFPPLHSIWLAGRPRPGPAALTPCVNLFPKDDDPPRQQQICTEKIK
jgi:hypothetical protein